MQKITNFLNGFSGYNVPNVIFLKIVLKEELNEDGGKVLFI